MTITLGIISEEVNIVHQNLHIYGSIIMKTRVLFRLGRVIGSSSQQKNTEGKV